jgi:hypothetical protein
MPSICPCPDCRERVLVESLADAGLRLRCPLCGATFEAAAVSATAEPAPPWAFPVLDERSAEPESAETSAPAEGSEPSTMDQPDAEGWAPTQSDADGFLLDEPPAEEPAAAVWDGLGEQGAGLGSPSRARRGEPQFGVLGNLIGVVLGGVIGIGLGYFVLLWISGRQGDFLHIWDQMPRILLPSEHVEP